jgi:hypothetical protein
MKFVRKKKEFRKVDTNFTGASGEKKVENFGIFFSLSPSLLVVKFTSVACEVSL